MIELTSAVDEQGRITSKVIRRVHGKRLEIEVVAEKETGTRQRGEDGRRGLVKDTGGRSGGGGHGVG